MLNEENIRKRIDEYDDDEAKMLSLQSERLKWRQSQWNEKKEVDFSAAVFLFARNYGFLTQGDTEIAVILREYLVSEDRYVLRACIEKQKVYMPINEADVDELSAMLLTVICLAMIDHGSEIARKTLEVIFHRVDREMFRRISRLKNLTPECMTAEMESMSDMDNGSLAIVMALTAKVPIDDQTLFATTLLWDFVKGVTEGAQAAVDNYRQTYERMTGGSEVVSLPENYRPTKRNYRMLIKTITAIGFGFRVNLDLLDSLVEGDKKYEDVAVRALKSLRDLTALQPEEARMLIATTTIMIILCGRIGSVYDEIRTLFGFDELETEIDLKKISAAAGKDNKKEQIKTEQSNKETEEEIRALREQLKELTLEARLRESKIALQKEKVSEAVREKMSLSTADEENRRVIEQLKKENEALKQTIDRMERLSVTADDDTRDMDAVRRNIGSRRLAVIGGDQNLTNKLVKLYPDWVVIPVGEHTALPTSLGSCETCYFMTSYMTHIQYNRYYDYCHDHGIRTAYLPRTVNVDTISVFICDDLNAISK